MRFAYNGGTYDTGDAMDVYAADGFRLPGGQQLIAEWAESDPPALVGLAPSSRDDLRLISCYEVAVPFADEVAAIARAFSAGHPLSPAGSMVAGSRTEDRSCERWRNDLIQRAEMARRRSDSTLEGATVLAQIGWALHQKRYGYGELARRDGMRVPPDLESARGCA